MLSILPAANLYREQLEIIIGDNASVDETESTVALLQKEYPWIRYHKHPFNLGAERNIHALARMASGEYVWFVGDDDKVTMRDALPIIFKHIGSKYNLIVMNFSSVARDLPSGVKRNWWPIKGDRIFDHPNKLMSCFGAGLGFISCIVISRKLFLGHDYDEYEAYAAYGFSFLYAVYAGIVQEMRAIFVASPLILNRWGTELSNETADKFFITGTSLVLDRLAKRGYSKKAIRSAKHRVIIDYLTPSLIRRKVARQSVKSMLGRMLPNYYSLWAFWLVFAPLLLMPRFMMRPALRIGGKARGVLACCRFEKDSSACSLSSL